MGPYVIVAIGVGFIAALFGFLVYPQWRRMMAHQDFVANLKVGDKVLTAGGVVGKITDLGKGRYLKLEIASGVVVSMRRDMVYGYADKPKS